MDRSPALTRASFGLFVALTAKIAVIEILLLWPFSNNAHSLLCMPAI